MEVDHFNPKLKGTRRDRHGDLLCASHHCNNCKRGVWPTPEQMAEGKRFINPYEEHDYGVHLVENRETGELEPLTRTGIYHLRHLGLNAPFLIKARLLRTETLLKKRKAKKCADQLVNLDDAAQKLADTLYALGEEGSGPFLAIAIPELPVAAV